MPKLYSYHPATGELLGREEARPDPLVRGRWLLPDNATFAEPPGVQGPNQTPVWDGKRWELRPDYRGAGLYDARTRNPAELKIGEEPDPEFHMPEAELPPLPQRPPDYREERRYGYLREFGEPIGRILETVIREQRARGPAVTAEAQVLWDLMDGVDEAHPEPQPQPQPRRK